MTEKLWSGNSKHFQQKILEKLRSKDPSASMDDAKDSFGQHCLVINKHYDIFKSDNKEKEQREVRN